MDEAKTEEIQPTKSKYWYPVRPLQSTAIVLLPFSKKIAIRPSDDGNVHEIRNNVLRGLTKVQWEKTSFIFFGLCVCGVVIPIPDMK